MHPVLLVTSRTDGVVYLNGVFQGEVRSDAPLFRPVCAFGAVYLEFRPFRPMQLPVAHRIVFSQGSLLPESVEGAKGVTGISWPFGISEISLSPPLIHTSAPEITLLTGAGRTFRLIRDAGRCLIEIEGRGRVFSHLLPADAEKAYLAAGDGFLYVSGDAPDGNRFALVLSENGQDACLSLCGREIEFQPGGRILFTENLSDTAGHIRKTLYSPAPDGFRTEDCGIYPNPTGEFQAVTPEECALCALDALLHSLKSELDACLAENAEIEKGVTELLSRSERAARLLFTPPDGRTAVALLQRQNPFACRAACVYYRAQLIGGAWKILSLSL